MNDSPAKHKWPLEDGTCWTYPFPAHDAIQVRGGAGVWRYGFDGILSRHDLPTAQNFADAEAARKNPPVTPATRTWDLREKLAANLIEDGSASFQHTGFDPQGYFFAFVVGREIQLFDLNTGALRPPLTGAPSALTALAWGPDGVVAGGGRNGTIALWDAQTGTLLHRLDDSKATVYELVFSPSSRFVVSGGRDGVLWVWDRLNDSEPLRLVGHRGAVHCIAVSPDDRTVVSGGADGTLRFWHRSSGSEMLTIANSPGPILELAFSENGRLLAIACENRAVPGQSLLSLLDCGQSLPLTEGP